MPGSITTPEYPVKRYPHVTSGRRPVGAASKELSRRLAVWLVLVHFELGSPRRPGDSLGLRPWLIVHVFILGRLIAKPNLDKSGWRFLESETQGIGTERLEWETTEI